MGWSVVVVDVVREVWELNRREDVLLCAEIFFQGRIQSTAQACLLPQSRITYDGQYSHTVHRLQSGGTGQPSHARMSSNEHLPPPSSCPSS